MRIPDETHLAEDLRVHMAFIKPFRYLVVYPAMEKQMAREWAELTASR